MKKNVVIELKLGDFQSKKGRVHKYSPSKTNY